MSVALLGGWMVVAWQNPVYEGKRLREWLKLLDDRSPVQRVGTGSRLEILMRRPAELTKDLLDAFDHYGQRAVPHAGPSVSSKQTRVAWMGIPTTWAREFS